MTEEEIKQSVINEILKGGGDINYYQPKSIEVSIERLINQYQDYTDYLSKENKQLKERIKELEDERSKEISTE